MERKNLLKAFGIIVPLTIGYTFLVLVYIQKWWMFNVGGDGLGTIVIAFFPLAYLFMRLFKEKIKSYHIFLLIFCGIILGITLSSIFMSFTTKSIHARSIEFFIAGAICDLLVLLLPSLFAWGFCAIKNKYIKVGFALMGLCYIHFFVSGQTVFFEWVMYIVILIYGIRICKKYGFEKKMIFYPLLTLIFFYIFVFILEMFMYILDGGKWFDAVDTSLLFTFITFLSLWFAYCCGFWFVKTKKIFIKILLPVTVVLLALFLYRFLDIELSQKFSRNSWTGEISKPAKLSEIEFFTDSTLNKITVQDLQKELYVLDFFSNSCGVCFEQMPKFQQLAEKYKEKTEIGFYAVNVFADTTEIAQMQRFLEKKNISLPLLFINKKDEKYIQAFGYNRFPQYNIIKNDTIIFDGYFEILDFFEHKYLK